MSSSDRHDLGSSNKQIAERVVRGLAGADDAADAAAVAAAAFADGFVDHAVPGLAGPADVERHVQGRRLAHPNATTTVYRVLGEGDLVFVHSHLVPQPGTRGFAVADIFRFEAGLIAEHWGATQEVPETTASGNDMFSTLSSPRALAPDPAADPDQTRGAIFGLFDGLVNRKDLGAWDQFAAEPYYQHSVNTPNGLEPVKQVWGPLITDPSMTITLVNLITDGDLIVAQDLLSGPGLQLMAFDVSRVRDGKIVEHWDVLQELS